MTLFMNLLQDFRDVALLFSMFFSSSSSVWLIFIYTSYANWWPLARENIKVNLIFVCVFVVVMFSSFSLINKYYNIFIAVIQSSLFSLGFSTLFSLHSNEKKRKKRNQSLNKYWQTATTASALVNDIFWLDSVQCAFDVLMWMFYTLSALIAVRRLRFKFRKIVSIELHRG